MPWLTMRSTLQPDALIVRSIAFRSVSEPTVKQICCAFVLRSSGLREDELVVLLVRAAAEEDAAVVRAAVGQRQTENAGVELDHLLDVFDVDADVAQTCYLCAHSLPPCPSFHCSEYYARILARFAALLHRVAYKKAMIDLISASETLDGHHIRAWTGVATDEGVGLICLVEVSDAGGRQVCRFEVLLHASTQQRDAAWSGPDREVARRLQDHALDRARAAVAAGALADLHGHRFEVD